MRSSSRKNKIRGRRYIKKMSNPKRKRKKRKRKG
jgi:hypothetical protein